LRLPDKASRLYFQIRSEQNKADQHLPKEVLKRLKNYTHSLQGRYDSFFNKSRYMQQVAVIKGPVAIKDAQAEAETAQAQLMKYDLMLHVAPGYVLPKLLKWSMGMDGLRQTVTAYRALKDQVPLQPRSVFEAQLNSIQSDFQKMHPDQTLEIGEAIGAGSIAQIFKGEIQSKDGQPQKVIIKVLRPDASSSEIQAQRGYLYYKTLLRHGTNRAGKKQGLEETEQTLAVLQKEIQLEEESVNAAAFGKTLKQMKLDQAIHIPRFYFSSPAGFVQEYAGQHSLTRATPAQRMEILRRITPTMLQMMLLSPEKYLDIHDGNFVFDVNPDGTVGRVSLIDFGRFARLDPKHQEHLLRLLAAIYEKPSIRKVVTPENLDAAVSALVDSKNNPHFNNLLGVLKNQMQEFVDNQDSRASRLYAAEQCKKLLNPLLAAQPKHVPRTDILAYLLTGVELDNPGHPESGHRQNPEQRLNELIKHGYHPVSIFNAWANYAYLAQTQHNRKFKHLSGKLLPLSNQAVAPGDLEQISKKFHSLFGAYFTHFSKAEREAGFTQVHRLDIPTFQRLFSSLHPDILKEIGSSGFGLFSSREIGFQDLRQAAEKNDAVAFRQVLKAILATDHQNRYSAYSELVHAYLVANRLEQAAYSLAQGLTARLPEASPESLSITTSNLVDTLREDFKLKASDFTQNTHLEDL
jgi:serine/threonine protein kinase